MRNKKQLSIALVSSYAFTKEPGGVKDFILGLKMALEKHNCEVFVIAPESKNAQKEGLVDFVLGMGFKVATDQTEFGASLSRKETAKKILEEIKPDIIVIHEPFVPSIGHTIISSLAETKNGRQYPVIIGQFHASREDFNWPLKAAEFIVRHFIRRPKLNRRTILGLSTGYVSTINNNLIGRIAVSAATKRFWQEKFPSEYEIIYNGIDTDELSPENPPSPRLPPTPRLWRTSRRARVILFAGRHDPRKGISDLINAFNILMQDGYENIKLKITGFGEMTGALQKMVEKLNLQKYVQFVGVLSRAELVKAYRTADLVVAPSIGGEGFNRTIIEARSCGTLVVCTDIGGHREAIGKDLSPFMAKPKNPEHLAKQILAVLNLSDARKQEIRKRGREDVESRFSWDKIAKEQIAYYRKLINELKN